MSAYRELGYGVMLFMSAMGGMSIAVIISAATGPDAIIPAAFGAVVGAAAWIVYKYQNLTPKT